MREATNKEVRQARTFLYRRGMFVTTQFCRIFAGAAKMFSVTFAEMDRIMRLRAQEE